MPHVHMDTKEPDCDCDQVDWEDEEDEEEGEEGEEGEEEEPEMDAEDGVAMRSTAHRQTARPPGSEGVQVRSVTAEAGGVKE